MATILKKRSRDSPHPKNINNDEDFLHFLSQSLKVKEGMEIMESSISEGMEIMEKRVKPMAEEKAFNQFATVADAVVELVMEKRVKPMAEEKAFNQLATVADAVVELVENLLVKAEEETRRNVTMTMLKPMT